jgi:hypothetical protein
MEKIFISDRPRDDHPTVANMVVVVVVVVVRVVHSRRSN